MAEGRATYKIDVDARGAQASLDGVVKGALPKFEKLSGSINAAASQLGGLGGAMGKTLGTAKQFGEAFLVSGPIGLGIAAGVLAVSALVEKMAEARERSESLAKSLSDAQARALGVVTQSYKDMGAELAALSGRSAEYRVEQAALAAQAAKIAAAAADQRERAAGSSARRAEDGGPIHRIFGIQTDEQIKAQEEWTKASGEAAEARAAMTAATNDLRVAEAALFVARERGTAPKGGGKGSGAAAREREITRGSFQSFGPGVDANLRNERELQGKTEVSAWELDMIAASKAAARQSVIDDKEAANERKRIAKDLAEEQKKIAKERADFERELNKQMFGEYVDLAQSALLSTSSMFFDVIEQIAAGQEVAFDKMAAGFIRNVGEQLLAIGVRQVFEGAGYIASGVATSNPALVSGGAQLVAVGLATGSAGAAMATSGAVAQGMISAGQSGGGSSSASGGVSRTPSRREGSYDDGSRAYTIVYNGGTFLGDPSEGARKFERNRRRASSEVHIPGMA